MLRFSLFVVGMMVASASMAGGASPCSVDMVPIQFVGEVSGPITNLPAVTTLSVATAIPESGAVLGSAADLAHRRRFEAAGPYASFGDANFGSFVATVTEHLAARLAKENLCLDSTDSKDRSLLQFVRWPLSYRDGPRTPVESLDARPSNGCRIISPWIDVAIERKPVPWIRAIVRWNQRQFLADQAALAGAKNVPPGVARPMTGSEFYHFAFDYSDSEILGKPTARPIEERVPPDLLWLLRRSRQNTFVPFPVHVVGSMATVVEKGTEGYTKLVIALIDRCLAFGRADIRYNSIFDAADLIPLEQCRIDVPLY